MYVLAFFVPPVALLLLGKPFQAILNALLCLTLVGIIPAMIWAFAAIANKSADRRTEKLVRAMTKSR